MIRKINNTVDLLFIYAELVLVPILGLLWLAARAERQKNERLLKDAIRYINVSKLNRRR